MKKSFVLVTIGFVTLVVLFITAWLGLKVFRTRLIDGVTIGDVLLITSVFLYGLLIYTIGLYFIRVSCRDRRRDN
ncbi:MAG: hypothetical protein QXK67_04575 [Pyrobaculum sp.]